MVVVSVPIHPARDSSRSSDGVSVVSASYCSLLLDLFTIQKKQTMKLALALIAAYGSGVSAFSVSRSQTSLYRVSTELDASRARNKKASRTKWAESRGYGATAVADAESGAVAGLMTNEEGLEYVRLQNESGDTSDVYLFGGVVTSYVKDGQEYVAVRPDAKMDGSKPISGGLSHCWPQVGVHAELVSMRSSSNTQ